jgi:two-component system sensor histidine kinase UhpB
LEALCEEFQLQSGVAVKLSFEGPTPSLPDDVALCIYRVSQEALQNVAKHAKADAVGLGLTTTDEHVRLCIRDDGIGFDADSRKPGLGLASIRERARLSDGSVRLDTRPGAGTELVVEIPITEATR